MTSARVLPEIPAGWTVLETRGPRPFVTHAILERPDGTRAEWSSRRHRKRLGLRPPDGRRFGGHGRRWGGRPTSESLWTGALFAAGSVCFALGSVPAYFDHVSPVLVARTFFVGSLLFTSAGLLQYLEALRAPRDVSARTPHRRRLRAWLSWAPRRIDYWAVLIQLVGTVMFNVSTFAATRSDLSPDQDKHLIWAPDVFGSVCFLVASWLAYAEVNHGVLPRSDRSIGWRISALNLLGSIAFGVSAVAARYLSTTDEPANIALVNLGTFAGALCFLVGAVLLPVESARDQSPDPSPDQ